jgi:hypothetical protein
MKKVTIVLSMILLFAASSYAQVAINKDGSDPNASSILHVKGSNGDDFYIDDASGKVGIGTTSPEVKLDVAGKIRIKDLMNNVLTAKHGTNNFHLIGTYAGWDSTAVYIAGYNAYTGSGGQQTTKVHVGKPERMTVDLSNGNVGIGTTNPAYKLDVAGQIYIDSDSLSKKFLIGSAPDENRFRFITDRFEFLSSTNYTLMAIKTSGDVGIGTTNPTAKLQVVGLAEYADNAAALAAGLTVGAFYRTGDVLKVVH